MKKYQDEMAMVIHQGAEALHKIGAINDEQMREFDFDCLAANPAANPRNRRKDKITAEDLWQS